MCRQRLVLDMMISAQHCLYDSVAPGGGREYEKMWCTNLFEGSVSIETPVCSLKLMPDSMSVCLTDVHSRRTANVYV